MRPAATIGAMLLAVSTAAAAVAPSAPEEDVKAAFLFNFARFVEWPPAAAARLPGTMTVAVLGSGPLASAVAQLDGKMLGDRRLKVVAVTSAEEARSAHMLLVTPQAGADPAAVAGALRGQGVLVVGDQEGFAARGGMINFVVRDNKVRFEVNLEEAQTEHLRLSSQLLKLATLVGRER